MTTIPTKITRVTLDPSPLTTLLEILNSVPPRREFFDGEPNTYVINEACEVEASMTNGEWTLHSVTTR